MAGKPTYDKVEQRVKELEEDELSKARHELEQRVKERTADLVTANERRTERLEGSSGLSLPPDVARRYTQKFL
ncbi:MAG TPA: hypothetical protein EYP19_01115 [Desulfobacterales bacterium]|nr:hypothetical protein [Desulfobacterales bacterium]